MPHNLKDGGGGEIGSKKNTGKENQRNTQKEKLEKRSVSFWVGEKVVLFRKIKLIEE